MKEIFEKMWKIMGKAAFFFVETDVPEEPEVPDVPEMPEGQRG